MELEPSGERMILDHYRSSAEDYVIYLLHLATYRFAERYTAGKCVLDYGCGSGYGSQSIAATAASVVAVDVDEDAIAYARAHHAADNLRFERIDPSRPLPFDDGQFDVVLSFQVFEHVEDTDGYLREIRRVLRPGGTLLLVTPDRSTRLLPFQKPWNRWHLKEYDGRELGAMLSSHFERVDMQGMTARSEMIGIEVRRCSRIKWLSLPFTLPIVPEALRIASLNAVHRIRGRGHAAGGGDGDAGPPKEYPFTIDDVVISANASPSVNLVAIAS